MRHQGLQHVAVDSDSDSTSGSDTQQKPFSQQLACGLSIILLRPLVEDRPLVTPLILLQSYCCHSRHTAASGCTAKTAVRQTTACWPLSRLRKFSSCKPLTNKNTPAPLTWHNSTCTNMPPDDSPVSSTCDMHVTHQQAGHNSGTAHPLSKYTRTLQASCKLFGRPDNLKTRL